jgi:hypothetical protein
MEKEREFRIKKDRIQKERKIKEKRKKVRSLKKMMNHMEMTMRKLARAMTGTKEMIWLTNQLRLMMDL